MQPKAVAHPTDARLMHWQSSSWSGSPSATMAAPELSAPPRLGPLLGLAQQVRSQDQHQRGPKIYALHAPEVECIGKGKARAPCEFRCKVSIATPVTSPRGGQFVLHAKALHGNPFDGHTLGP